MNCVECQELLQLHLDGGPAPNDLLVQHHLRACPECRGMHAAVVRLEEGLRLFTPPAPPLHFATAVVGRVLFDQRARRRARRRWGVSAALAASLFLAVCFRIAQRSPQAPVVAVPTVVVTTPETAPAHESGPPSPFDLVAQSRSAVAGLPRRVAEGTAVPKWTLSMNALPELPRMGTDGAGPALEKASASLTEAKQGAALAWEAVEAPMRRATDVWSRLTPSLQKE